MNAPFGLPRVAPVDAAVLARAREAVDALAKPPGSLGQLEELAVRLCGIAGAVPPPVPKRPVALVFAADHGVVAQGVSRWPSEVTAAMVGQIAAGRAAGNVLARAVGAAVRVVDVGVASDVAPDTGAVHRRLANGTQDMTLGPAMDPSLAVAAVDAGVDEADEAIDAGADVVCVGEMGIGNTTAAAALICVFAGKRPAEVVGPGASGQEVVEHKREVVSRALALHEPRRAAPWATLAAVGGLEHAAMAGAILGCAARRVPVIVDGVNACAAALVAATFEPRCVDMMVAGHLSTEPGAAIALEALGLRPVVDMGMRLGEASGALMAVPAVRAAAALIGEMARLDEVAG